MQEKAKTTFRTALGIFLIIFGVAGLILPILPGWWVIPIGLELLGWRMVINRHKPWRDVISFKHKHSDENKEE